MFAFIHWHPDPEAIAIGPLSIKWYGILWSISLFWCYYVGLYVLNTLKRDTEKLTLAIQYIFIGGVIGARLGQVFFYEWSYFSANPLEILYVWKGGLASHGGLIGAISGLWLFCRRNHEFPFFFSLDMGFVVAFGITPLIRLGNLLNSEIIGRTTDVPWAFIFDLVDPLPRHPVVLYEAVAYALLTVVFILLFRRYTDKKPGLYASVFFIAAFAVRLSLEFLKEPEGGMYFNLLSKTQMLNLPFIALGIVLFFLMQKGKLKYNHA